MSNIADILDIIDRSAERTLRARPMLTASVKRQLGKYREAARKKATEDRTARRLAIMGKARAAAHLAHKREWAGQLIALRLSLREIKRTGSNGKRRKQN